jgi:UrcA family protein
MRIAIKYLACAAVIGLGALSNIAPGYAMNVSSPDSVPTKLVGYSDLNVDSPTGARTLYRRLRAASREVCVGFEGIESMQQRIAWSQCYSTALSEAVAQVNSAALTGLYAQTQSR